MKSEAEVLAGVERAFERNFSHRGELGASVSVWRDGRELLSLGEGWCEREKVRRWTAETLVPVYSATKGPAAATLLWVLADHGLGPDDWVERVWPGFPVSGATFGEMLSHQCGLAALDVSASVWDRQEVIAAIEAQEPNWRPGTGHGYHPRTWGFLLDEVVRRLAGEPLGDVWRRAIAGPLDLDFWIGLPPSEFSRVARLYPGKADKSDMDGDFYREFLTEGTLVRRAFSSPRGLQAVQEMNAAESWAAGFAAFGGVGSASALGRFYQAASGALGDGIFTPEMREWMSFRRVNGDDQIMRTRTAFSAGMMMDPLGEDGIKQRQLFGSSNSAFGSPGAGGSHAFGDPATGWSFAYVMNQMELSLLPARKSLEMVEALAGR
jgi:CubicO group peptidase (beta-lactamase class C family)